MDEPLPDEPSPRPPIAQAPVSAILLVSGSTSDAVESVAAWQAFLATLDRPFELLLVPIVEPEPSPVLADMRQIPYDAERGIGPALQAAIEAVQHPLVALATADHQYRPDDLKALLAVIDKVDLAIGCRSMGPRAWWRRALAAVGRAIGWLLIGLPLHAQPCIPGGTLWRRRWVARWAFGLRLVDPESVFRLMRRDAVRRIILQSRGWFALVEQLAKANHLEFILSEEPIAWAPPAAVPPEPAPFGQEARALFCHADFGPPELHVPPPTAALPVEIPTPPPTTPPSGSS
jgi:hypothetical protein